MSSKKRMACVLSIILALTICGAVIYYVLVLKPYNIAVEQYDIAVDNLCSMNQNLDNAIFDLEQLISNEERIFDDSIREIAIKAIENGRLAKIDIPLKPDKTEQLLSITEKISQIDYTDIIEKINEAYSKYDMSVKSYKQFVAPTEAFVIERLERVEEIIEIAAVTEDNDPNGKLNKAGGYTATVYFESANVNQKKVYGTDLIAKGTDAGGAIEVYRSEEDAIKRDAYLAVFDGTIIASGSHKVVGTVVIRTSNELTATQQSELEAQIIRAFSVVE